MPELSGERSTLSEEHRSRTVEIALVIVAAALAYAFSFKLPFYPVFTESDHLIFVYEGWRMWGGDTIYRDFFQFTLPGSQVYYASMFSIFGARYWIAAVTTVVIAAASCWMLLRVSAKVIPSSLYLLPSVLFIFFGFRWFGLDASHRMFSPIFMMAAVLVVFNGTTTLRLVSAGLLCALTSFFTQQRGVVLVLALAVFLLIESRALAEGLMFALRKILILVVTFASSLLAICLPFIITAGADEFFHATLVYPALYYKFGAPNHFGIYFIDLEKAFSNTSLTGLFAMAPTILYAILLPITTVAAALWLIAKRRSLNWPRQRAVVLVAVVAVLCLLSTTAPNQYRLFQISMPMLVVVTWWMGEAFTSQALRNRIVIGVSSFAIAVSLFQAVRFQTNWHFVYWNTPAGTLAVVPTEQFERYLRLTESLSPGEPFFEVYEPFLYFPLQLKNPTRFGQIWPSDYTRPEHVAEVIEDLKKAPPRYILWDNSYNLPAELRPAGDNTAPLSDFVKANYAPVGKVYMISEQPIQIWERKTSSR